MKQEKEEGEGRKLVSKLTPPKMLWYYTCYIPPCQHLWKKQEEAQTHTHTHTQTLTPGQTHRWTAITFISPRLGGTILLSSTLIGPSGISFRHCKKKKTSWVRSRFWVHCVNLRFFSFDGGAQIEHPRSELEEVAYSPETTARQWRPASLKCELGPNFSPP